jgi:hypothetical protein
MTENSGNSGTEGIRKCERPGCGDVEFRIDGYCSIYCRDIHEAWEEVERIKGDYNEVNAQLAAMRKERDDFKIEAEGYQRLSKEATAQTGGTLVVLNWNGAEMRIFGPTADQERRMAGAVAEYIKLINALAQDILIKQLQEQLASAHAKGLREAVEIIYQFPPMPERMKEEWMKMSIAEQQELIKENLATNIRAAAVRGEGTFAARNSAMA